MIKILTIIAVIIGIFLRLYGLSSVPEGLFSDEISIAVNAKTIAENGTDEYGNSYPFAFESFSDYKLPGYIYSTAIFYSVFGNETFTPRLPAAFASIASIFLLGYLSYVLFPKQKNISFFSMIVISLSPYHIQFSRMAYETMLATCMLLVFSISLCKIVYKKNKQLYWLFFFFLSSIVSIWTYPAPKFIVPALLTAALIHTSIVSKKNIKHSAKTSLLLFLPLLIAFFPSLTNKNIDSRPLGYVLNSTDTSLASSLLSKIEASIISFTSMFNFEYLFKKGDNFALRHGTREAGVFLSVFAPSLIVGAITLTKKVFKSTSFSFLFLMLIIFPLPSTLTSLFPYGPRFLPALIPLSILIAVGTETILKKLPKKNKSVTILFACIGMIALYQVASFMHVYFVHYKRVSKTEMYQTPQRVAEIVSNETQKNPDNKIYLLGGRSCREWGHEILHVWYFSNLDNKQMIEWNNAFRNIRYQNEAPFSGYDTLTQPTKNVDNIIIHPNDEQAIDAPSKSIIIRCALHKPNINWEEEQEIETIYLHEQQKQDAQFVVTEKK